MRVVILFAAALLTAGCSRASRPAFAPPVRPPVFIQMSFESAFNQLRSIFEARGHPLVVEDAQFGTVRTDWVYYEPGDLNVSSLAVCPEEGRASDAPVRARFGFDVRRRTVQSTVTIRTQWQIERLPGFEKSERAYMECRSTGEWERLIEATLTQRGTIR